MDLKVCLISISVYYQMKDNDTFIAFECEGVICFPQEQ